MARRPVYVELREDRAVNKIRERRQGEGPNGHSLASTVHKRGGGGGSPRLLC